MALVRIFRQVCMHIYYIYFGTDNTHYKLHTLLLYLYIPTNTNLSCPDRTLYYVILYITILYYIYKYIVGGYIYSIYLHIYI